MQLDHVHFSSRECLVTSHHVSKWKKKRSRWRKHSQRGKLLAFGYHANGMSPTTRYHEWDKLLTSESHVGGITPTYGTILERTTWTMVIMLGLTFFVKIPCWNGGMGLLSKSVTHRYSWHTSLIVPYCTLFIMFWVILVIWCMSFSVVCYRFFRIVNLELESFTCR